MELHRDTIYVSSHCPSQASLIVTVASVMLCMTPIPLHTCAQNPVVVPVSLPPPLEQEPACGTRFVDPSSSALLADIVLQGNVQGLRQASPISPLLYRATVNVHIVYKGKDLLEEEEEEVMVERREERKGTASRRRRRVEVVEVEQFGPHENKEACVARVLTGQSYVFFLKKKTDAGTGVSYSLLPRTNSRRTIPEPSEPSDHPLLVNSALPRPLDMKALKQVKKVLCPDCPSAPVITRLGCKHCSVRPSIKRQMSANNTKTVREGQRLALRCVVRGSPRPSYTWLKDGRVIYSSSTQQADQQQQDSPSRFHSDSGKGQAGHRSRRTKARTMVFRSGNLSVRVSRHYSLLVVKKIISEDSGTYVCLASNPLGQVEQSVAVTVQDRSQPSPSSPDLDLQSTRDGPGSVQGRRRRSCARHACYNGGTCRSKGGFARCHCAQGYRGNRCQFHQEWNEGQETNHSPATTALHPIAPSSSNDTGHLHNHVPSSPSFLTPLSSSNTISKTGSSITTNDNNYPVITTIGGVLRATGRNPIHSTSSTHHTKKPRRKYGGTSASGASQVHVTKCSDQHFCLNGGTCKMVVKLQRRFCQCRRGFAGHRCERIL